MGAPETSDSSDRPLGLFRAALAVTPAGDPCHMAHLVNLGIALEQQFKVTGEPALLTEALQAARDALAAAPTVQPLLPFAASCAARSTRSRWALHHV